MVGFVFSIVAVGLLVISFGLSSIVSVGCSITGIVCSRNGKRKVEPGRDPKHKGLAQAGYIVGWVGLAPPIRATAGWILAIVFGAVDESSGGTPAHLPSAVAVAVGGSRYSRPSVAHPYVKQYLMAAGPTPLPPARLPGHG